VIRSPLAARLGGVALEVGQYVKPGEVLFEAAGVGVTEVEAQVPVDRARTLFDADAPGVRPGELLTPELIEARLGRLGATVRFRAGPATFAWEGDVARIRERLDRETRTIGFVVAVADPYALAVPGERPPLVGGMLCEVELRAPARPGTVVVPRAAVRDGAVFVVDGDDRLERRPVELGPEQADFAVVLGGLAEGEAVVVSDPTPAVEGLLVEAVPDDDLRARLVRQATGGGEVR